VIDRNPPAQIGFLVKTYPKLSETFILEEILGLENLGVKLHIFSLNPPQDAAVHAAFGRVKADVTYLSGRMALLERIAVQCKHALRNPSRYVKALWFAMRRPETNGLNDFLRAGFLGEKLRALGISHLHAHFISEPAGVAEMVNRLTGIRYSISAHAKDIYLSQPNTLQRKLRAAAFTVTCTCYNRSHMTAIAPSANIFRMYHGIDLQRFSSNDQALKLNPPLILSVGRLREKKGFATLIKSCFALHLAGISFRCEIVGYGEDQAKLQRLIDCYGLAAMVVLTGKMTHTQLIERYRQATLFVLPSQIAEDGDRDGIPNVLLEAMAMTLPVVSTDVSGIPEVIKNGVNGFLVPPRDALALQKAMVTLLSDAQLRARMGKEGRHVVESMFSNDVNLLLLSDLLRGVPRSQASLGQPMLQQGYSHAR
jgi:glycosyltransferase involved in cell wall biosynthesis